MDYENKGSNNVIVLGVLSLAAMFFAYLIHSSKQTQIQPQPIQTAQLSTLDTIQSQTQSLLNTLKVQSQKIEQLSKQSIKQLEYVEPVNVVSMPTEITRLNKNKLGFSDSSESIAASFGMV